jgi:hypothetical protein
MKYSHALALFSLILALQPPGPLDLSRPDWNPRSDPTPRETGLKAVGPLPVARQVLEESRRQSSLAWNKVPQVGCFLDATIRGS